MTEVTWVKTHFLRTVSSVVPGSVFPSCPSNLKKPVWAKLSLLRTIHPSDAHLALGLLKLSYFLLLMNTDKEIPFPLSLLR